MYMLYIYIIYILGQEVVFHVKKKKHSKNVLEFYFV